MQSSSSSPRSGALVSLVGVALILLGFFLPTATGSNPQIPGSAYPVYEWQFVGNPSNVSLMVLSSFVAALPLLGMLIVLAMSVAALFRVPLPRLVVLKRAAATWGLALQLLFDAWVLFIAALGGAKIALGFVVVPLGFLIMAIGVFVIEAHPSEVQVASSSPRIGAVVSLVGVALILLGFFLPMFTLMRYPLQGPVYEWQVNGDPSNVSLTVLFGVLAALPLLGMLIVLATSVAALFRVPLPRLVVLKRAAAAWGLATQLFFDVFAFFLIGIGGTEIAWGFVVVPLGFLITVIGASIGVSRQGHERAKQS